MKSWLLRFLVPLAACQALPAHADAPATARPVQADPFAAVDTQRQAPTASAPAGARPSDEAIRAAVRATLEEMPYGAPPAGGTALSGGAYREFARKFSEAEKGHCLGPNALKHQPHSFVQKTPFGEFLFGATGVFALPFWGAAIVRGKCSWSR